MREIELTKGKVALVDDEDYDRISAFSWHAICCFGIWYAQRQVGRKKVKLMHTEVLGMSWLDHKDGNGLNNQKENIRPATRSENAANARPAPNQTGFAGVKRKSIGCFEARIVHNDGTKKTKVSLGCFKTAEEAHQVYVKAHREKFGEFSYYNREAATA